MIRSCQSPPPCPEAAGQAGSKTASATAKGRHRAGVEWAGGAGGVFKDGKRTQKPSPSPKTSPGFLKPVKCKRAACLSPADWLDPGNFHFRKKILEKNCGLRVEKVHTCGLAPHVCIEYCHMPRPKRLNDPVKLNLLIDRSSKDTARKLALERGISISRLFESLVANTTVSANESEGLGQQSAESEAA